MSIFPLEQFEADLAEHLKEKEDREAYERLNAPSTMVVRFGFTKMVGEFPYSGDAKPGCGSKIVVQTHRGTEVGEMLTSTCPNSGCGKSVSRKEMLEYIENSGGRKYPFFERGRALRIATKEDMDNQSRLEQRRHELRTKARGVIEATKLDMRLVEIEELLGQERTIVYYSSEDRLDLRSLYGELGAVLGSKVDMVQVGARDEARIIADYERCGQYCCCKNFLKVLKPVSMRSAKVQKATLDPLKISGRCGRLMCCLRYEDETYEQLRKNLPNRKKRVGTPEGDGIVIDSQILTQLVKVRLDSGTDVAVPVEELTEPGAAVAPERPRRERTERPTKTRKPKPKTDDAVKEADPDAAPKKKRRRRRRKGSSGSESGATGASKSESNASDVQAKQAPHESGAEGSGDGSGDGPARKKRRRRRRRRSSGSGEGGSASGDAPKNDQPPSDP